MPSKVSKPLPVVEKVAMPVVGGNQTSQTDAPPGLLAGVGSPASAVAVTLLPRPTPLGNGPGSPALAKLSANGSGKRFWIVRLTMSLLTAPSKLKTTTS